MAIDTPSWATEPTAQATPAWASTPQPQAGAVPSWATPTAATPSQPAPVAKGTPESNVRNFLNFLSKAEGASYNTIVGGGSFSDFSKHPNVVGLRTANGPSTAAGAYQITGTTYRDVAGKLGIKDFSETSQDQIAIELIRQKGALNDVANGNWEAAINKLGGVWASLPSSQYGQAKRSMEWSIAVLNGQTPPPGYQPFAPVRKNVDPKSLNSDQDWVRASMLMYELFERKPFQGTPADAAEYGKDGLGNFNFNMVSMAEIAHAVSQGTQEQKQAFLYMLDTYDNTQFSWEGTGRGFKAALTDPTNLIGVGTLGVATVGKFVGRKAAVEAAKQTVEKSLLQGLKDQAATSLGRTGVVAGIDAGVMGAASSTIKQGVEVSAGRREEISLGQVALDTGVAAAAGAVVGTAADMAVAKISRIIRGETVEVAKGAAKAPESATEATPSVSGVAKKAEGKSAAEAKADALINPEPKVPDTPLQPRDANLGSTLTPAEIAAATERKQKGRLEADNIVPDVAGKADIPVDVPKMNTGLRSTPMSMEELTGLGDKVATQLRQLPSEDLPKVLEQLRTATASFEETRIAARGVQMYADELRIAKAELVKEINANPNAPRVAELQAKVDALDARMTPLEMADDAFGSMAGSLLRQRQEGLPGVQGMTVESIMKEQNLSKADAEKVWADMVSKAEKTEAGKKIAAEYDAKADALIAAGDLEGAAKVAIQKNRELASLADEVVPGGASFIQKLTEFAISNVFSFKTVLVNLIPSGLKTLVIPGLKAIVNNPLDKVARIEAMASYSAMRSSFGAALQAAKAGFRYEQALLTRDGTRLVEGELAMTGKLGGGLRIFPRILNASDEFLSRINYDSFIAGRAAADAAMKATEKGLTGDALDQAVEKAVKAALATSREISKGDELVQPIINKGRNLGLTGEDLFRWVEKEAMRDPEALRKGTDEEALNFVRDVLYKRQFSGEGSASKAAVQYEETLKKFPSLKLVVGQLFFRTPIRVFEEGIRLTPGLQLLAPNFIQDLAGNNGTLRQVRAQAEAMSSLAVAGGVLSLYAQGRITGDGAYSDWKQQRTRTDGPLPEPYTIKFSDGSTWSYRSFDPLATPIKIMVNGLERMDRLRLRESQGEFIGKDEFDKAMAYVTVGTTAVAAAIRDANLVAGIDGTIKFFENLADPERKEDAMLKMVGEKLFLLVPNTLHKIAKDNDPTIKDPVTFWQVVEEKLLRPFGRDDVKTPYSYDVLGNVRKMSDTGSLWNVFSTSSVEERGKGMSEEGKFVMSELDRLSRVTGATFKPPTKHKELGDFDMRTIVAADGKSTLYDVWQKNYKEMQPDAVLYPIMKAEMPDGTFKTKALRVELVQQTISDMQDAAFYKMLNSEQVVVDKLIENTLNQERAKAGLFDSKRPY